MNNIFKKIGKKDDEDGGNKRDSMAEQGPSRLATALQNMNLSSGSSPAQTQPIRSQPAPSGSTTLPQTANAAPPPVNKLNARGPAPLGELSAILASPASSYTMGNPRDLIQISLPGICPVCCNFDPYQAPPDRDSPRSWAMPEFNIPAGTTVGNIELEKSEEVLESAKRGCLYCTMIQTALGAVHSGWESEKSFVHIFLAPGLPVSVRLQFGSTATVVLGREEATNLLGVEVPEGQQMAFIATLEDPSKPPIDVEIYQPRVDPGQLTVADHVLSPLVEYMGVAEEVPAHAGDQKCFEFIKEKVAQCIKEHKCGRDGHLPMLPARVIWIEADNASSIRLVEPKDIRAKYIAVSYCWGSVSPDTYLTDASTFDSRKAGIHYEDLPPLFQDVVDCARVLGIEYVWIDRLCIIQGSADDFKIHAPKMGETYGNATLTIAAASATSEKDPILVKRDRKWLPFDLAMKVNGIGSLKLRLRRRTHLLGKEETGRDYGEVSTRVWIWQERLLSGRTVFYTPSALKFECRCHSVWEGFGPGVTGHSWSAQLDNISHRSWVTLVDEYMRRDISRPSDRLPAMEAVMKRIQNTQGWSPLWGMWTNTLVESLGWQSNNPKYTGKHECRMNPGHYAPTWSWASVDGPITHVSITPMEGWGESDPINYDLEVRKLNAASGLITFLGHVISTELSCRVEINNAPNEESNPTKEKKFNYRYKVLGVYNLGKPFPATADVPLKPWSGNINGQYISTVIRIPYGEAPPEKSWTAPCLCLMVSRTKMQCLCLLLGASLRESGASERVGMVDGLDPDIFRLSQRSIVNIS